MGGAVSGVAPAVSTATASTPSSAPSAGKSAPVAQNTYSDPYQAGGGGAASYNPSAAPQGMMGGKSAPIAQNNYGSSFDGGAFGPPSSGKSSGLGQGGYQSAPAFQQPQGGFGPAWGSGVIDSTNTTTQQDMMGGNRNGGQGLGQVMQGLRGGKSSGLGQGGYQSAPAFQQPQVQQPVETQPTYIQSPYQQPQQRPFQQQFSPYGGGYGQQGISGLQGLYNNMMGQYQQPMQQMPRYGMQGGMQGYRPNMQGAQSALSRVKPSVQKQVEDANLARIKELEDQLAAYSTPTNDYGNYGGG